MRRRFRSFFHYTEDRTAYPHSIFLTYFSGKTHPLAFFYDIFGLFFSWIAMQYAGIAFEILDVQRCIHIWASWYFIPHIVSVTLLVLFAIFPHRSSIKKTEGSSSNKKER
jgi:lysophospholipid acyltransferase